MKMLTEQKGVALLEVVIALFVVGFGLVAIAMFSNGLFTESGQVKARTEALQYAQEEIEQVRNTAETDPTGIVAISTAPAPRSVTGTNAVFTITRSVNVVTDPGYVEVVATVSWTDQDGGQSVSLNGIVTASDADAVGGLVAGSLKGGGFVDDPQGTAKYITGETITSLGLSDDVTLDLENIPDGSSVYKKDETFYLVDEDENVLLSNKDSFNLVIGRVAVEAGHSVAEADIEVVPSDTGVCRKTLAFDADTSSWETDMTTIYSVDDGGSRALSEAPGTGPSTEIASFFEYTCFFGSGWYGSIGVLRDDTANSNDATCGGDPNVGGDDGTDVSRHPQLMATRAYRGFTPQIDIDTNAPYIDANNNWIYLSTGMVAGHVYGKTSNSDADVNTHDFLLTRISGTKTDAHCHNKLVGSDLDADLTADLSYFKNNSGSFVCLVDADLNANCPDVIPLGLGEQVTATATQYTGTITADEELDTAQISGLAVAISQGGACSIGTWALDTDTGNYMSRWTCDIYHYSQTDDSGTTILTDSWAGQVSLSSSADNVADGGDFTQLNICSVSRYNSTFSVDTTDTGINFDVSPDSCATSTVTIAGSVESVNKTKTIDLTGYFVEAVDGGTSINCGSLVTMYPESSYGFSCELPAGFTGTISINDMPAKHRVKTDLDYSGLTNGVVDNLTGQIIQIQ